MTIIQQAKNTDEIREMFSFADEILHCAPDHPRNVDFYVKQFEKEPSVIILAEENGAIVGVLLASEKDEDTLLLGELAVSPSSRGKGQEEDFWPKSSLEGKIWAKKACFWPLWARPRVFTSKTGTPPNCLYN